MYLLAAVLPRLAMLGLAGVYVWTGSPVLALVPLALAVFGWGLPRVY